MSTLSPTKRNLANLAVLAAFLVASSGLTLAVLARRSPLAAPAPQISTPAPAPTMQAPPPAPPKQAVTNASVYVRSGKGTNSSILGVINEGTTVTLGNDSDVNWQQITSGNLKGYVFKAYLKY